MYHSDYTALLIAQRDRVPIKKDGATTLAGTLYKQKYIVFREHAFRRRRTIAIRDGL